MSSAYAKYRGKCREAVEALCAADPTLTAVRGHYVCWSWGKQPHWWAVDKDGNIVDPTVEQFPSPHIGQYVPFDGHIECVECGKEVAEEKAHVHGNYVCCSHVCMMRLVGL